MALPSYISVQTTNFSSGTSITFTKPANTAVGDLLMLFMWSSSSTAGGGGISAPSGWNDLTGTAYGQQIPGSGYIFMYYKVATSTEVAASSFGWSYNGDTRTGAGGLVRISGESPLTSRYKVSSGSQSNTNTPSIAASVTPDGSDGSLLFQFWGVAGNVPDTSSYAIATSNPTWTEVFDIQNGTSNSIACAVGQRSEVTGTGNVSATGGTGGTQDWGVQVVSIPPPIQITKAETTAVSEVYFTRTDARPIESVTLVETSEADKYRTINNEAKSASTWLNEGKS